MPTIEILPSLGGRHSTALGIDNQGQVVGTADVLNGSLSDRHAVLLDGARTLHDLYSSAVIPPNGLSDARAIGLDPNGITTIVGRFDTPNPNISASGLTLAYQYIDPIAMGNSMSSLGSLWRNPMIPGTFFGNSWSNAINSKGFIVGGSATGAFGPNGTPQTHAFLWNPWRGKMSDLGTLRQNPKEGYSEAFGINELGHVVGISDTDEVDASLQDNPEFADEDDSFRKRVQHAFLWDAGTNRMFDLGTLTDINGKPLGRSCAFAINDQNQVTGWSDHFNPGRQHWSRRAFIYDPQNVSNRLPLMTEIGPQANVFGIRTDCEGLAINNHGTVVGRMNTGLPGLDGGPGFHAFVHSTQFGFEALPLKWLPQPPDFWIPLEATGINDAGLICCIAVSPTINGGLDTRGLVITP